MMRVVYIVLKGLWSCVSQVYNLGSVQKLKAYIQATIDQSIGSTETNYIKLNTKTRNQREKKKFSFLKCIQKSNVIKKLGFSI